MSPTATFESCVTASRSPYSAPPSSRVLSPEALEAFLASSKDCLSGRLTKTLLMTAPAGAYLVSNLLSASQPIFAEAVADSFPGRLQQWTRIKSVGANHRLCYVFESKDQHDHLRQEYYARMAKNHAMQAKKGNWLM